VWIVVLCVLLPYAETSAIGCNAEINEVVKCVVIIFKIIVNRGGRVTDGCRRGGRVIDGHRRGGRVTDGHRRGGRVTDGHRCGGRVTDGCRRGGRVTDGCRRGGRVTDYVVCLHCLSALV